MAHSSKERHDLESIMDKMGVAGMFEALPQIAGEKADHVQEAWQDRHLAKRWEKLAAKFEALASGVDDPYYPGGGRS
jgi:hypothetical protein